VLKNADAKHRLWRSCAAGEGDFPYAVARESPLTPALSRQRGEGVPPGRAALLVHQIHRNALRIAPTFTTFSEETVSYREVSEVRDGMRIDWDMPITMDDGLVLRCDVFRPNRKGRYPVILSSGPYGKWLHFED